MPENIPLNKYIDHTLLKPEATRQQIETLCDEAAKYQFASVAIHGGWVTVAAERLASSGGAADRGVKVDACIGFPLGANVSRVKRFETEQAIADGAGEIDMVINIGAVKSQLWDWVRDDIAAVLAACRANAAHAIPLKVILETALLTDDEKRRACQICKDVGVDFVKTSTGFSTGGATVADVKLMRSVVGPEMGVKASGGVRTRADALAMIEAGATRIGTSAGIAIVTDASTAEGKY